MKSEPTIAKFENNEIINFEEILGEWECCPICGEGARQGWSLINEPNEYLWMNHESFEYYSFSGLVKFSQVRNKDNLAMISVNDFSKANIRKIKNSYYEDFKKEHFESSHANH